MSSSNLTRRNALTAGGVLAAGGVILSSQYIDPVNADPSSGNEPDAPIQPVDPVNPELKAGDTLIEEYPLSEIKARAGSPKRIDGLSATMCGVVWNGTPVPDIINLRWKSDDSTWSSWVDLEQAFNPDTGEASEGTEPVWLGSAHTVEIEAVRNGRDVSDELTAHLVTTSPRKQDVQIGETTSTAGSVVGGGIGAGGVAGGTGVVRVLPPSVVSMSSSSIGPNAPDIVSRSQWGANEKLTSKVSSSNELKSIIIHHTEGSNTYSQAESPQQVRGILAYHTQSLGWADIGYNFLVDRFGTIYEARHGGVDRNIIGAHARGFNSGTCGISVMGSYTSKAPSPAAMASVAKIAAWKLLGTMTTDVYSTSKFSVSMDRVNFKKGSTVSLPRFFGHRDVNSTDCPGNAFYSKLGDVRKDIQNRTTTGYKGHLNAYSKAGGKGTLGTVTSIAHPAGSYVVTLTTKGFIISDRLNNAIGYVSPFASNWNSTWGRPTGKVSVSGSTTTQVFQNGTAKRVGSGSTTFTKNAKAAAAPSAKQNESTAPSKNQNSQTSSKDSQKKSSFTVSGPILTKWKANGGEKSLGKPKSKEYPVANGGRQQEFEKCHITYSPKTGARITKGVIDKKWVSMGGSASSLKLPTSDAYTVVKGFTRQDFQNGSLMYNASTGVQRLHGAIGARLKNAAVVKSIGAPLDGEHSIKGGGVQQRFQKGMMTWSSKTGARLTRGGIQSLWLKNGGASGRFGFPITDEYSITGGRRQEFQKAVLTWSRLTGKIKVSMKK